MVKLKVTQQMCMAEVETLEDILDWGGARSGGMGTSSSAKSQENVGRPGRSKPFQGE